ncbi:MAG: cellulose binding domain-containing protein, partial [Pseudomonadota bacterium]
MATFFNQNSFLDLVLRSTWGSGLVADLSLTPTQALNGWTVTFDYSGEIANIWNARIVSRVGDRYVVEAMGYNAKVSAGGTVSFGFQGSGSVHDITPVALVGEPIGAPDDPVALPSVSVSDALAAEGDGAISFTLSLSEASATDVTIDYRTVAATASAGGDFASTTAQIVIPAGQTTATITIALTDDTTAEDTEAFTLELLSVEGADLGDATATGTITDTDVPPADPIMVMVTGGSVIEADPGMAHMHGDGSSHLHDDGHRYITFTVALAVPA